MEKGYIVYESLYYASEYIKQINDIPGTWFGRTNWMRKKGKGRYSK